MTIPDHYIRVVELPAAVRGVTLPNDDGTFSIYINALYNDDIRRKTLEHELEHLARDHFYTEQGVAVQEAEASGVFLPDQAKKAPPAVSPKEPLIRRYKSLRHLKEYLRSIGAL